MSVDASLGDGGGTVGGTWMAFYDQAFKVELSNGLRFIANYRYSLKDRISNDPLSAGAKSFKSLNTDDYDSFFS